MSKSMNMLRTRRRDNNVKPNRRLDRKSSRGMIYENEELRLKTININAEIERGQSDIKKLKRENEMLKKEIWCLRDEYEKLDKLLKDKDTDFSSSSTTCTSETESCSSCTEDSDQVETSQNLENVQKTNMKNLRVEFDHLSMVPEENSTENSDRNSESWQVIKPDQGYPGFDAPAKASTLPAPRHFFSPLKTSKSCEDCPSDHRQYYLPRVEDQRTRRIHPVYESVAAPLTKSSTDLIVKMDNRNFGNATTTNSSSFSNGGNLEELLNDIENISQDILKLSNPNLEPENYAGQQAAKPYKSELNVVLMPTAMPLIGFDKYMNIQLSRESVHAKSLEELGPDQPSTVPIYPPTPGSPDGNPFFFGNFKDSGGSSEFFNSRYNPDNYLNKGLELDKDKDKAKKNGEVCNSKTNLLELSSGHVSSENEENLRFNATGEDRGQQNQDKKAADAKSSKMSIRRKVSIHFKGKKDKKKDGAEPTTPSDNKKPSSLFDIKFTTEAKQKTAVGHQKTASVDSKRSNPEAPAAAGELKTPSSSDEPKALEGADKKPPSISPERGGGAPKHVQVKDESKKPHKKHKKGGGGGGGGDKGGRNRRSTASNDRFHRERSYSVCTDRSNILGPGGFNSAFSMYDENSEGERTNSISSCGTVKMRKMSNMSNFPVPGKIPWCGCWGNGCL